MVANQSNCGLWIASLLVPFRWFKIECTDWVMGLSKWGLFPLALHLDGDLDNG